MAEAPPTADLASFGFDLLSRWLIGVHEGVFRASRGTVLGHVLGMEVLILTTTGRRSGQTRTTMLTTPVAADDRVVLVASNGGADHHPGWFHNLSAHPDVSVLRAGRDRPMRARVTAGSERAALWAEVVSRYPGYGQYQTHTDRAIPVVVLEA